MHRLHKKYCFTMLKAAVIQMLKKKKKIKINGKYWSSYVQ